MPRNATQELPLSLSDFKRGINSGVSERGVKRPDWLAAADNLYGRPYRAMRVRPGSRNISEDTLPSPPHSLMAFYAGSGNKLFVGTGTAIKEVTASAYLPQTLPGGSLGSSDILSHTNLDGVLIVTQRGGAQAALMYDGAWNELRLPAPAAAPTFAADSSVGGSAVDAGSHYYRIRWRFKHGSSLSGPVSAQRVLVGPNNQINLTGLTSSGRPDFLGWTLERTKVNGTANGPWWFVADGTGATYSDTRSDALLGYIPDEGIHTQPVHFDGVVNFAGRLWGWAGSSVYASQDPLAALEATGIANFDPDLNYPAAKDDGDTIQTCLVVLDELLILKKHSVHIISGVDPESFVLTSVVSADPERGSEAGCAGPRAACVIGGKAYFWGESGGLFSYSGGKVVPEAWLEMGRYLDEINPASLDELLLINHQGNYMLAWYPRGGATICHDQVVYDARFRQWWHWIGWTAKDAIELKGGLFGNATLVYADPANRSFFPAIAAGSEISEVYVMVGDMLVPEFGAIPAGTTVAAPVASGDTALTLSQPATETLFDITLLINGVLVEHCNTVSGSTTVTASGYRLFAAFDGFRDGRDVTGFGGDAVRVGWESPWIDFGLPDEWKDLDRLSFTCESDQIGVSIAVKTDPQGGDAALSLTAQGEGASWAADAPASDPGDLVWDLGDWASDTPTTSASGLPFGTIGRRFKFVVSALANGDHRPTGLEAIAVLLPDKESSR